MSAQPSHYIIQTRTAYIAQDTVRFFVIQDVPDPSTGLPCRTRFDLMGTIYAVDQTTTVRLVNGTPSQVALVSYRIQYMGPNGLSVESIPGEQITGLVSRPVPGPAHGMIMTGF
ncbi:hypothetical protein AURDEDRAFT_161962 [Auricularia subglabra TFB-10046 SS5]|nr:hypothetical protein AURDEDRAFT_161962 [Auricularia subglabra TFB-10046 SS5]